MRRKLEDEAARLAFGDMNPQEAEKLRQKVAGDRKAEAVVQAYADMRDGLKSLAEIPEDQFSKDRLRDAILTQGLKPVPTRVRNNRNWLWMPATASAMGFVLMFSVQMLHRRSGPTNIVVNAPKGYSLGSSILPPNSSASGVSAKSAGLTASNLGHGHSAVESSTSVDPDEVDPRISASNFVSGEDDAAVDPDLGSRPTGPNLAALPVTDGNLASLTASNNSPKPASAEPIILIDQDKDDQTGACRATEVGSSSNVLVGG